MLTAHKAQLPYDNQKNKSVPNKSAISPTWLFKS